jgi:hypothetical protein
MQVMSKKDLLYMVEILQERLVRIEMKELDSLRILSDSEVFEEIEKIKRLIGELKCQI